MSKTALAFAAPSLVALALAGEARADAPMISLPSVSAQQSTRIQSPGMVAGGVVLSVLGLAGTTLGVVALVLECTQAECGSNQVIGGVSLGLSLATEVTGIVLIAVGATPRPMVTRNDDADGPRVAVKPETKETPDVFRLSLRGLGLRMNF